MDVEYASDERIDDESTQSYLAMRKVNTRMKSRNNFTRAKLFRDNVQQLRPQTQEFPCDEKMTVKQARYDMI